MTVHVQGFILVVLLWNKEDSGGVFEDSSL